MALQRKSAAGRAANLSWSDAQHVASDAGFVAQLIQVGTQFDGGVGQFKIVW